MRKAIITCLCLVATLGVQANVFKSGWTSHDSNHIKYDQLDVGWNNKGNLVWNTNVTGIAHTGRTNDPSGQFGQVISVNSGTDTGNVVTLSFDWSPADAPNTDSTLGYQLIGWNEIDPLPDTSSTFFYSINWGGKKVGTFGDTHARVDLINGGPASTVDNQNMTLNTVTTDAGTTTNVSISVNINNLAAGITDFSDYEFVGVRFGMVGASSNSVDSVVENISLTLSYEYVEPVEIVSGSFIDTDFTAADSYGNGDLVGQDAWAQIAPSLPQAFNVDTAGAGFAETETFADPAAGGVNQVFYTALTSNEVNATWSGTVKFALTTEPDGGYRTNITAGVTNVYEIAELGSGYETFMWGVTSDSETLLDSSDGETDDDVLITARVGGNDGRVDFGFNMYNWNVNIMLTLDREELGWDPNGYDVTSTNGADFATDMIELDYVIGKQADNSAYMATVTATVNGVTYAGTWKTTAHDTGWGKPTTIYSEAFVQFAMGRGAPDAERRVNVIIDSLSVIHTADVPPPMVAPYNLYSTVGGLENTVGWKPFGGETGFNVYRAEAEAGPYALMGSTTEDLYADNAGLQDLRSYFYKVTADYSGTESVDSRVEIVRALAQIKHFSLGGNWTDGVDLSSAVSMTSGTYELRVGSGQAAALGTLSIIPADATETQYHPEASQGNICAVIQTVTNLTGTAAYELIRGQDSSPDDDFYLWCGQGSALFFVEGAAINANSVEPVYHMDPAFRNDGAAKVRAVIYSGGIWYASEKSWAKNEEGQINVLDAKWAVLTVPDDANDPLMDVSASTFVAGSTLDLSQLSRAGFLFENSQAAKTKAWFDSFKLTYGSKPSAYQLWCDDSGIYNDDTVETLDLDSDDADNVTEWGLGGDPLDPANVGITERYQGMDASGNMLYIHPQLDGAGPTYVVKESSNLVYVDFDAPAVPYESVAGGAWPGEAGFIAVTNVVPVDSAVKFIKLEVE